MFRFSLAIALLLPTVALADDVDYYQDQLRKAVYGDLTSELDGELHASASAQAGRDAGPRANAGGEVAWNVGLCRALFLGGEGNAEKAQEEKRAQWSGSIHGGFCLPFPMNRFEMTLQGDYELPPGLSRVPVMYRARYTGFSVKIENTFVGFRYGDSEHQILPLSISIGTLQQSMVDTATVSFEMAAYRKKHDNGRVVEVLPFAMRAAGPARPAVGGGVYLSSEAEEISPLRIRRTSAGSLGGFTMDADLAAGLAYGSVSDAPASGMGEQTVTYRKYDMFVDTTLRATRGSDVLALSLRRAFEPTYTDELVLDTRADASWTRSYEHTTLLAGAFVATTKRFPVGDSTPSGGVRGAYVHRFAHKTQLLLAGELARSFYAQLDNTLAQDAAWSAQASATFSFATR